MLQLSIAFILSGDMDAVRCLLERLRPLVGLDTWDYCVLWKLSQDQSFIEWVGCCCGGAGPDQNTNTQNCGGGDQIFTVSGCKDLMFQHKTTKTCHLLAQLPSSLPFDSAGSHGQTIIENQPRWINSTPSDERVGTRVLIPVSGGLIELFAAKPVPEDPHILDFVISQCNVSWEQEAINTRSSTDMIGFTVHDNQHPKHFSSDGFGLNLKATSDNLNMPWDLSLDQNHQLCNPPMNFFGAGFEQKTETPPKNDIIFQGSTEPILSDRPTTAFNSLDEHGFPEFVALHHQSLMPNNSNLHQSLETHSSCVTKDPGHDKDSIKQESGRADSVSDCSDQMEDDDDNKAVGRTGRRHQSKNLVAERKRRKKLNDRLYTLRSLVPKITKMDRASILGDAIEFVKELQKQVKDLQDELEEPLPEEDGDKDSGNGNINSNGMPNDESPKGIIEQGTRCSSNSKTTQFTKKQTQDFVIAEDKTPQMEVQVEVTQIDGNEFFLKVFCEHKPGGFVRLMEAMNALGLEVTNANVTTCRDLVLNVFRVEKRDNEAVQAEHVRDSLLELTRNPMGGWSEHIVQAPENGGDLDFHHHQHSHHHHNHNHHINSHHQHQHLHSFNLQA